MRFDHTAGGDFSEDQFIPLTFKSATTGVVALPVDEITATINNVAVSTRAPASLGYRQVSTVTAFSKAGAALTYETLSPNCALVTGAFNGIRITPLKGSGECAISVTSAGTATTAGITAILPIRLTLGVQTIPAGSAIAVVAAKKPVKLAGITNFGEKLTYKASGSCSVKRNVLTAKKGKCTIDASAKGQDGLFGALEQKIAFTIN
jgi:hypothetical protein